MAKQIQLQLALNRAAAVDLEILEQYKDKESVIQTRRKCYGGVINKCGIEFIHLKDDVRYDHTMDYLIEYPGDPKNTKSIPNQTISRSQIEKIVLLKDISRESQ